MKRSYLFLFSGIIFLMTTVFFHAGQAGDESTLPKACIDGTAPGWISLWEDDFVMVNGNEDTWTWKEDVLLCSGQPVGVMRSKKEYTNFEFMVQWRHLKSAGNSGFFAWAPMKGLEDLPKGTLPGYGIEVQMLDHGYATRYIEKHGKKPEWFSTNGDVFAVGKSKLKPFPPTSPNGSRSFPRKNLSKGVGQWNHYYVRAINGEIRLWVNGEEVSGGNGADPASGYICLESEGSPIEFKNIRIRELP